MVDSTRDRDSGLHPRRPTQERLLEALFQQGVRAAALAVAGLLVWIAALVLIQAWPAMRTLGFQFLITRAWSPPLGRYGLWPSLYGTVASAAIALLLAGPIGLGVAICLSEDYLPPRVRSLLIALVELLAAVPSVVYGLWGLFVLIPWLKTFTALAGPGLLPAALVLAIMILPIIAALVREALGQIPPELRQAALSLGATRWETLLWVVMPAATSGIIGAIMLALGRALGETMAATMLIGNATSRVEVSLLAPASTIAALLANQFAEAQGLQVAALMYAALVLFALTFAVNLLAHLALRRLQRF